MHFAGRHGLTPPAPRPAAWLGAPLPGNERPIGALTLRREDGPAFSRWHEQLLRAVSNQASAAIQNARLYGETVRLYTLTDAALARRLEQLQALLNSVQEGVVMIDTAGQIVLVNPVAARLLGAPPEQLRGEILATATAVSRLGYTPQTWEARLKELQRQEPPAPAAGQYEISLTAESGEGRAVIERNGAPVLAEDGRVMGWLMTLRDVTDAHELARRRADLIRMIVHDLRNPVTTVLSALRTMEKQLPVANNGDVPGLLQDAQQGSHDLLDMIDSLMDINRMEAGQAVVEADAMRLPPLVEQVMARLAPLAAQREVALRLNGEDDLPVVWGDREMLRRVVVNLLDNGLKFTPAGGSITVTLSRETAVAEGYQPGVRCAISDTGPGIPPEFREQIFDRFMRTNRGGAQVRGTGLGLTFCKLVIEAHDGRIWNEARPGGGSQFIFTIPGIPIFT
jgi:PAS domain S-box-containing protein